MAERLIGLSPFGKLNAALATACTMIARNLNCPGESDGPGTRCSLLGIDCPLPEVEAETWDTDAIPIMAGCWRSAFVQGLVGDDGAPKSADAQGGAA